VPSEPFGLSQSLFSAVEDLVGTPGPASSEHFKALGPEAGPTPHRGASLNSYYGCCGVVAGGVAGGPSVGGEAGRRYHIIINARTTAAAMMSNLFVSIVPPTLPRQAYPAFAGRNKLGESLIKPCLVEDHNDAPQNHGYFGPGSPFRRPPIFVGAPDNSDYSGQNVREWQQKEENGQGNGQTGRDRCYGGSRRYDICDRAIGDSVFPESLAERDVTSPECCHALS
jgi:hypothetical protein